MSLFNQLGDIHWDVLCRFTYRSDRDNPYQYNRVEYWQDPEHLGGNIIGDCEDFALACRTMCRAAGIKSRLVHCNTETGEAHLVLESDGWILDNRQQSVMARDDLNYQWNAISGYEPGKSWHLIKG